MVNVTLTSGVVGLHSIRRFVELFATKNSFIGANMIVSKNYMVNDY